MHNTILAHLISVQGLEYIVHFIVGLAYFYNKYVTSLSFTRNRPYMDKCQRKFWLMLRLSSQ